MWKTAAAALLVTAAAAAPSSKGDLLPVAASDSEVLDYLIQDVCVDSADRAVALDPASCQVHRNLRVGEPLPYILTDFDRLVSISHASLSSIPVKGTDGHLKILVVKNLQGRFTPDYRFSFSARRDAFDLIDVSDSNYASIVRTFDGGCFDQLFSPAGRTDSMTHRAGGWILFPTEPAPSTWPVSSSAYVTTWRTEISAAKPECADNHASGITVWYKPTPYRFESQKSLTAIRTDHFAAADLSQPSNSFERFYFTREYGMTRWESWITLAECHRSRAADSPLCSPGAADNPLRGRCSLLSVQGQNNGGKEHWGGQDWVRIDCRDLTRFIPLRRPQLPLSPEIATGDGLVDIDYKATLAAANAR